MDNENLLQQKDIEYLTSGLNKLETSMIKGFSDLNLRLDIMNDHFVKKDLLDEKLLHIQKELESLRDSNKWLFRTVTGVVLGILITGILTIK